MTKQHIVKSVFWLTVAEIIFNLSGYIVHAGVGRILGPSEYGRYGLVITLTTMIIMLIGRGIPSAMNKYISEISETKAGMVGVIKNQAAKAQLILIGSVTVVFYLLSPTIASVLNDPSLTSLFQLSSLIIPSFAAASFYFYYFTGIHRFNIQSALKVIRSVARVILIIGLALLFKIEGTIAGYIAAPLTVFAVGWAIDKFWISKKYPADPKASFNWRKLVAYAWPITLFMLFYEIFITLDLYMVKAILKDDFLTGIYNGSLTVGRIPYYLFYALAIVLLPTISKSTAENNAPETKKTIQQSLRFMLMFLLPIITLMYIYAYPIINIFYGFGYSEAARPMQILLFGVGFLTIFYVMSFAFNGAGKVKIPMYIALFGMIVKIILTYIFIQSQGIFGAAAATTITSVIVMAIMLYYINKHFKGLIQSSSISKMFFSAGLMYLISFIFPGGKYFFILWGLILFGAYLLLLSMFGELKKEDFNLLKKLVSKKQT
ncbi:oligosaccharide flippase family protein [Patescibacteria group bacterium]